MAHQPPHHHDDQPDGARTGDPVRDPHQPDAAPDAGPAQQPLSRAERRGARRRAQPPRPGEAGRRATVPVKRPVGRGRDPRLPRR